MGNIICNINESVSVSVRNMSKVYFCCHPEDFEEYYPKVRDELYKISPNISIWYYDRGDEPDVDEVNQMNLIVIVVTNRFLEKYKGAKDSCYKVLNLAKEKHIPQLPLLQEGAAEEDYAMIFGNSQYLSKLNAGSFAISYEEKLKKRLRETLLIDVDRKQIEDAFMAIVFLSYRKKDRKFVHRIMELIHSNEKYRDVGVWYDEFLTPGEAFDEQIEGVLANSDLFVLMVTSNLLEKGNYVIENEYPKAVEYNRPIIPIECAKTNEDKFREVFPEIEEVYPVEDTAKLYATLSGVLKEKNTDENVDEAMHMYLIGMAYLDGVNVEKNSSRAIELFSKAADLGCDKAYERLAVIYHNGDGVEDNPEQEIVWRRKYVAKLENEVSDENSKTKLMKEKVELARCIFGRLRFDEAKVVYKEALGLLEQLKDVKSEELEVYEYQINSELGDSIRFKATQLKRTLSLKEVEEAKEYYLCALEKCGEDILKRAVEYSNIAGLLYQLAEFILLEKRGKRDEGIALLREAETYCMKALEMQKDFEEDASSYEVLTFKSIVFDKVAGIYRLEEKYDDVEQYFKKSLDIWEKFKSDYPSTYHRNGYALASYNYAETLYFLGRKSEAQKMLTDTAKLIGELKDKGDLTHVGALSGYRTHDLLTAIFKECRNEKKAKNHENAAKKFERSLGLNLRK